MLVTANEQDWDAPKKSLARCEPRIPNEPCSSSSWKTTFPGVSCQVTYHTSFPFTFLFSWIVSQLAADAIKNFFLTCDERS